MPLPTGPKLIDLTLDKIKIYEEEIQKTATSSPKKD
jgi:hypothetical protein